MICILKRYLRSQEWFYLSLRRIRGWLKQRRHRLNPKYVHPTFYINGKASVSRDLIAGAHSFVNLGCRIGPKVIMGKYVMLGPNVSIIGGDHQFDQPGVPIIFSGRPKMPTTVLEDDCWLGFGVTVIAGVRIGRGAIVAAGAVVTKDVEPYSIVGGVPAQPISQRFKTDKARQAHDRMLEKPLYEGTYCKPYSLEELTQAQEEQGHAQ